LGLRAGGVLAQSACQTDWYLGPDDCICMNSTNGALLVTQTFRCCRSTGYKTAQSICGVDRDNRQDFKDCCKDLNQKSVIGHCR
ncbi:hypothetical protein B0T26DRAFT_602592, partial [Lasiosphaeria miniovina]